MLCCSYKSHLWLTYSATAHKQNEALLPTGTSAFFFRTKTDGRFPGPQWGHGALQFGRVLKHYEAIKPSCWERTCDPISRRTYEGSRAEHRWQVSRGSTGCAVFARAVPLANLRIIKFSPFQWVVFLLFAWGIPFYVCYTYEASLLHTAPSRPRRGCRLSLPCTSRGSSSLRAQRRTLACIGTSLRLRRRRTRAVGLKQKKTSTKYWQVTKKSCHFGDYTMTQVDCWSAQQLP